MAHTDTALPGITAVKDTKGNITEIRISLARCGDKVKKMLEKAGIIAKEPEYDPKYVADIRRREKERTFVPVDDIDKFFDSL